MNAEYIILPVLPLKIARNKETKKIKTNVTFGRSILFLRLNQMPKKAIGKKIVNECINPKNPFKEKKFNTTEITPKSSRF